MISVCEVGRVVFTRNLIFLSKNLNPSQSPHKHATSSSRQNAPFPSNFAASGSLPCVVFLSCQLQHVNSTLPPYDLSGTFTTPCDDVISSQGFRHKIDDTHNISPTLSIPPSFSFSHPTSSSSLSLPSETHSFPSTHHKQQIYLVTETKRKFRNERENNGRERERAMATEREEENDGERERGVTMRWREENGDDVARGRAVVRDRHREDEKGRTNDR